MCRVCAPCVRVEMPCGDQTRICINDLDLILAWVRIFHNRLNGSHRHARFICTHPGDVHIRKLCVCGPRNFTRACTQISQCHAVAFTTPPPAIDGRPGERATYARRVRAVRNAAVAELVAVAMAAAFVVAVIAASATRCEPGCLNMLWGGWAVDCMCFNGDSHGTFAIQMTAKTTAANDERTHISDTKQIRNFAAE